MPPSTTDIALDRLSISDFAATVLTRDLAADGLRLAAETESGWTYRLPGGVTVWVTDVAALATQHDATTQMWLHFDSKGLVAGHEQHAAVAVAKTVLAREAQAFGLESGLE